MSSQPWAEMAPDLTRTTGADGTSLAAWDWGGPGEVVVMCHGTSLHGRCWQPVATELAPKYRVVSADLRGHGASGGSPDGQYPWDRFGADVLALVDQLGPTLGRLRGAGHSAGAASLLLAESLRPGTFASLWLWEPIITVPGSSLRTQRAGELAARARRRRSHFESLQEAHEYLDGRGMFAEFSPEAFAAFIECALVPSQDGGVRLACCPEVEARVYEAAPWHDLWDRLSGVGCPVRLCGGDDSPAVPGPDLEKVAARLPHAELRQWPGTGHFGPFGLQGPVAADIAAFFSQG